MTDKFTESVNQLNKALCGLTEVASQCYHSGNEEPAQQLSSVYMAWFLALSKATSGVELNIQTLIDVSNDPEATAGLERLIHYGTVQ